tara:strand:- start:662 stop:928 length:267 start_codon:yes stop_codon:yes gene_type:complete
MAKITKEQLEKIQDQQKKLQGILTDIGVIEVRKHEALHAQAVVSQEIEETKKELEKEYGSININMQDGTYTKIEENDDSELSVVKSED